MKKYWTSVNCKLLKNQEQKCQSQQFTLKCTPSETGGAGLSPWPSQLEASWEQGLAVTMPKSPPHLLGRGQPQASMPWKGVSVEGGSSTLGSQTDMRGGGVQAVEMWQAL